MAHPLPDWLIQLDLRVWHYLNATWHNEFWDVVMPFLRNQFTWAPLYLFLLIFMAWNFGWRGLLWCAGFLLCFGIADQISAHLIKPYVQRLRPCNDQSLKDMVHIIVPCGSGYSFPSSHAANHFALGTFMAITINKVVKKIWPIPILWALAVSYAQVYVGVHFPVDVTIGGLIGIATGLLVAAMYQRWVGLVRR